MAHIRIFLSIFTIVIGSWSLFYLWRLKSNLRYSFITNFIYFLIVLNIIIFLDLLSWYTMTNLMMDTAAFLKSFIGKIGTGIFTFFSLMLFFTFAITAADLDGYRLSIFLQKIILTISLIILICWTVFSLFATNEFLHLWYYPISTYLFIMCHIGMLGVLAYYFFVKRIINQKVRNHLLIWFVLFYAIGYLLLFISRLFLIDQRPFFVSFILILFNLFPMYWGKVILQNHLKVHDYRLPVDLVSKIKIDLGITDREAEIASLLISGLNNSQIEDKLCISSHTVKNHIYNLYKKTGVKNRTQLTNYIHNHSKGLSS